MFFCFRKALILHALKCVCRGPVLRPEDEDKFVAIDVESGDHEIDEDDYAAVTRLRSRRPSAEVWLGRVGQPAAYRMRRRP